jgi:hypothetical protein
MLKRLSLEITSPIDGKIELHTSLTLDKDLHGETPMQFEHRSVLNGGPIDTLASDKSLALATVKSNDKERGYAVKKGSALWIRGTFCSTVPTGAGARIPVPDDPAKLFPAESLLRAALAELGYSIKVTKPTAATRLPVLFAARCRNGYFFSGYAPSTTATLKLRFPFGAPLLVGKETWLEDGHSAYTMPRAWHNEARVFVDQADASEASCVESLAGMVGFRRRMLVKGLKNAKVTFLPENKGRVVFQVNDMSLHVEKSSVTVERNEDGTKLVVQGITGSLFISW